MTTASAPPRTLADSSAATDARERVRAALAAGSPVRIVGGATWLDAGRHVNASAELDMGVHAGIVEYVPGDLTITALAGTTLADLERATAAERQWLPLDPFGDDDGTLGATVATAAAGPLAHGFGAVRDNVLGLEVVTGRAEIVRAGGRVVKNVAGFDLTRLMIGAWGTLGVITEVTMRLRARPEVDRTLVAPLPADPEALDRLLGSIRRSALAPLALQLVNGALARKLRIAEVPCLLVRLGGNEEAVRAQAAMMAHALEASAREASARESGAAAVVEVPATVWPALRQCEPLDALVLRLAASPTQLAYLWSGALEAAGAVDGTLVHAWGGSGTVRVIVPAHGHEEDAAVAALVRALPESRRIGERLPPGLWARLAPSAVDDPLSRRVREAFDPGRLLNPGILGESLQ